MRELKADWAKTSAYLEPQRSYLKIIREELGEDGIFVDELTQMGYAARIIMPIYKPRSYFSSGYQGTLGYGFPTALGAKVARPDLPVLSIAGDGGFMFSVGELATAVQHRIPLVTIIFNNDAYGNVRTMQIRDYDERVIATDLVNPDFVKLGESFGANAFRAEDEGQLRQPCAMASPASCRPSSKCRLARRPASTACAIRVGYVRRAELDSNALMYATPD